MNQQWFDENVPKYMPLQGYTIPWPLLINNSRPGDAVPKIDTIQKMAHHNVRLFMDGRSYMRDLVRVMTQLQQSPNNGILWIHGWYFQLFAHDSRFEFNGYNDLPAGFQALENTQAWKLRHSAPSDLTIGSTSFAARLRALLNAGVDVRVMSWINPLWTKSRAIVSMTDGIRHSKRLQEDVAEGFFNRNMDSIFSMLRLREVLGNDDTVCFNTMAHPLGGMHAKFVLAGNDQFLTLFAGGVDLSVDRYDSKWHDATVKVNGPAAKEAATFYKDLWNELAARPVERFQFISDDVSTNQSEFMINARIHTQDEITSAIPNIAANNADEVHAQLYVTMPRKYYAYQKLRYMPAKSLIQRKGYSSSLAKAAASALPNLPHVWTPPFAQYPNGRFELKTMMHKALRAAEKYIFIIDQSATNQELAKVVNARVKQLREQGKCLRVVVLTAFRNKDGHQDPMVVKFCKTMMDGINNRDRGDHFLFFEMVSHAKVVLVDDKWLCVGSGNCMRRSFYTDLELGLGMMHDTWVKEQRHEIWNFFKDPSGPDIPDDTDEAICFWSRDWARQLSTNPRIPRQNSLCTPIIPRNRERWEAYSSTAYRQNDPDSNDSI